MNKLRRIKSKVIDWAVKQILKNSEYVVLPVTKYADLGLQIANLKSANNDFARNAIRKDSGEDTGKCTPEQLLMKQLGSYIPSFEPLEGKSDEFKNSLGRLCREMLLSPEFQYLIDHLKQDQVNIDLFGEGEKKDKMFVRGSINGIYIVDEQIRLLAIGYIDRLSKGLIPTEKKVEPKKA